MDKHVPIYVLIGLLGVGIGLLLQRPVASPPAALPTTDSTPHMNPTPAPAEWQLGISDLHNEVTKLTKAIDEQTQRLDSQQEQIAQLQQFSEAPAQIDKEDSSSKRVFRTRERGPVDQAQDTWFDLNAMIVAGVDEHEAGRLRKLYEDIELKKLFLRDKAVREGWNNSTRYSQERADLEKQLSNLRDELDANTYDAFLYAAGRPNRVIVRSLLSNSPAEQAGVQAGDILISYSGERVYNWSDIRSMTTQGQTSDMVALVVQREGKQQTVYVPRGPLGVKLDSTSIAP